MSVSGQVSITSGIGTHLVFTVTGTNTLAYAQTFQNILLNAGQVNETVLNPDGNSQAPGTGTENFGGTYTLDYNIVNQSGAFTLPDNGGDGAITFVDPTQGTAVDLAPVAPLDSVSNNGGATITGSGSDDYVLFTGINPPSEYIDVGGNNTIIFTEGNNLYDGSSATGTDIVVTGTGSDTVDTGTGPTTVFAGSGHADITLNDTTTFDPLAPVFNDFVYLNEGSNTVTSSGTADAVFAYAPDQTIFGSSVEGGATIVTILPNPDAGASGGDSIYAGAASVAVFDSSGGNTLFGDSGTGLAYFIAGPDLADTIISSNGPIYAFGSDGDSITFSGSIANNVISGFAAGLGNETLNGAGTDGTGALALFGANPASAEDAAGINTLLIGGSGLNGFVTGEGNETLVAGTGTNVFYIQHTSAFSADNSSSGTILVKDFGLSDNNAVTFVGYTADEIATAEDNATVGSASDPSYTIKLSDGTTVEFMGVNSLTGHTF